MKILSRLRLKVDAYYQTFLAHSFRVTGHPSLIKAYLWRRSVLLSPEEVCAIGDLVRAKRGNFLIFGAGNDSVLWHVLNLSGVTAFLEGDEYWMRQVRRQNRSLRLYRVTYTSRLSEVRLAETVGYAPPALDIPVEIRGLKWDTILVDAPQGWGNGPGRIQSIHEASQLLAPKGRILVHDCDRDVERYLVGIYLRNLHCRPLTERLWLFEDVDSPPA